MTDKSRLDQLLEELLDSQATPDDVCRSDPELLPEVRARAGGASAASDRNWTRCSPRRRRRGPRLPPEYAVLPRIPGYEVQRVLGSGGSGVVYEARHLRLKRTVALKMLLAGSYAQSEQRERFLREAEAVACLRHPNVVQLYDVGEADGRPYFTMELVEGGSLSRKLEGAPVPARRAAALVAAVAEAVQAAHASGIVHRDLKPGNVLLTLDGTPKVTDFGLARRLEGGGGLTLSGAPMGTPSYMAPEQARGDKVAIGPATDVYALGAILYEVLTGRPPFRADTAAATLQQVMGDEPVPPARLNRRVPRDLETICLKCLHKEPQCRYASAQALAEDLHRFLRGAAIRARLERRLERLVRRVRRRPVLSTALAAGTLLAVAVAAGGLWLISERSAAARAVAAEHVATERAADEDLREMARCLKKSSWVEARAALERAKGRLEDRGSAELRYRLDQAAHELELAAWLEEIRIERAYSGRLSVFVRPDEYEEAFRGAGLGQVGDDPEVVAARVRASNIPDTLVAALDHWSVCTSNPRRRSWVLSVARLADPDPTGWRDRARDPAVRADQAALVEVIQTAPVADQSVPLLLALNRHLTFGSRERLPFLKKIQQMHPADFWANLTLGKELVQEHRPEEATRYFQVAVAVRPRASLGHHELGTALLMTGRTEEAVEQFRRAVEIEPTSVFSHHFLAGALMQLGRQDEAIEQIRVAVRFNPNESGLHTRLGDLLEKEGRYAEADSHLQQAVALDPKNWHAQNRLRSFQARQGRGEEARVAWQKSLEADPPEHDAWYGYAEFCLFLGQEDEYRRARQALLSKFGATTTSPVVTERTVRAWLLRPATEDELRQAVALAERAVAVEPSKYQGLYLYFLFTQGLAEYRRGHFDRAISLMRGEASQAFGPAPRLVLAMALHRSGQVAEARKTLAAAVLAHDWRASQVSGPDGWTLHVLRREAEGLILPNLPAFLEGNYQPRDNDERLALLGVCEFEDRRAAQAGLCAAAFAADPKLAEDLQAGLRYSAACAAAVAGCAGGADGAGLSEAERAQWRQQAREWLRLDLDAWTKRLGAAAPADRAAAQKALASWRQEPDLAGLRDAEALKRLPVAERQECAALWQEIAAIFNRARATP